MLCAKIMFFWEMCVITNRADVLSAIFVPGTEIEPMFFNEFSEI